MRVDADGARGPCCAYYIHALSGRHCHMRMCTWGRVTVGAPEISHGRVSVHGSGISCVSPEPRTRIFVESITNLAFCTLSHGSITSNAGHQHSGMQCTAAGLRAHMAGKCCAAVHLCRGRDSTFTAPPKRPPRSVARTPAAVTLIYGYQCYANEKRGDRCTERCHMKNG